MGCFTCVVRVGVVFLVILNTLTLLLGIGIMAVGIILKTSLHKETDIVNFMDEVKFGSVSVKQIIDIIFIVVIVIGAFVLLTSVAGCAGAICKIRALLITYVIVVILCILLELTALGFWVTIIKGADDWLSGEFNSLLKKYRGVNSKDIISAGWDLIFMLFDCCGVHSISRNHNDFQTLPSEWWSSGSHGSDVIPGSCCTDASLETYRKNNGTQCTQNFQNYNTAGCYDVFENTFKELSTAAIAIVTIMVATEIVAVIFGILITHYENMKKKSRVV